MRICVVDDIAPDTDLPRSFYQVSYHEQDGDVTGVMSFRAVDYEDAKQRFFTITKGEWDGYNWPVTGP